MTLFDIIVPYERSEAHEAFERRMDRERIGRVEHTGLRKDGSTFPFAVRAATIERDGAVVGTRGFILDVTELKGAARTQSLSDDYERQACLFEGILSASAELIFIFDLDIRYHS